MSIAEHLTKHSGGARALQRTTRLSPMFAFVVLNACLSLAVFLSFVLAVDTWSGPVVAISFLVLVNAIWISGGATTAILGLFTRPAQRQNLPASWQPTDTTAILITLCREDPAPVVDYLSDLTKGIARTGLHKSTQVFILSDTSGENAVRREEAALSPLVHAGLIRYRRRTQNTGHKPGNIADWLTAHGDRFDHMLVMDADSKMTASCIRDMIWRMEQAPNTGLLQAGIALVPGRSLFGKYQRTASRLLSRNFGRGFGAWSGKTANYWGHNAIIRVQAFRTAARLPQLPGNAPFGGAILSHDFVEAAWMRRAGWDIEMAPDIQGSAEDAPQTLAAFFRRDRRWCQGNLQHLRIVCQPGLHPLSRFHLITGIFSYIAAPIWLLLVVFLSFGTVSVSGYASVFLVGAVLLTPKICALADNLPRARTRHRRLVIIKAAAFELIVSALVAPLILLRHATSVVSILLGQDCGWKSSRTPLVQLPDGWIEGALGLAVLGFAATHGVADTIWLAPIFLPLLIAPLFVPMLNRRVP